MSNTTAMIGITKETVAAALVKARQAAKDNQRWLNAANRAYEELGLNQWAWDGQRLVIASRSKPGTRHVATAGGCDCPAFRAGRACFHRAAVRLIQLASQAAA